MRTIWILNHHSGLEGDRHYELAKELVKQNLQVVVFLSCMKNQSPSEMSPPISTMYGFALPQLTMAMGRRVS